MRSNPQLQLSDSAAVTIVWQTGDGGNWAETRTPGASLSDLPTRMRSAIRAHWTPERVAAWQAEQDVAMAEMVLLLPSRDERINRARSRRLAAGTVLEVDDMAIAVSAADRLTLMELRLAGGDAIFRDAANVEHTLSPGQIARLWTAFRAWHERVYRASWRLKDSADEDIEKEESWT